jgi:putative intracellular protease/amidase/ketosteroid isomerase-like protein
MGTGPRRIGVLIEDHFDQTEYRLFNSWFPEHGYEVEYLSHLWGQPALTFGGNPDNGVVEEHVTVTTDVVDADPADYAGIVLIGAYAMDRLRYQPSVVPGRPNSAPAVEFLRRAMATDTVRIGTICHSLWLLCADPAQLRGRRVTCAHNIVCDVENAGATVVYDGDATASVVVDGNLVTAKHPEVTEAFMARFVREIEREIENPSRQESTVSESTTMSTGTADQVRAAVSAYVDSFNLGDREMFLGVLADRVVQIDPVGSPPRVGRDALAGFWDSLYAGTEKIEFEVRDLMVCGGEAALVFHITAHPTDGPAVHIDGVDVFAVTADGRIALVKGYSDDEHVRAAD